MCVALFIATVCNCRVLPPRSIGEGLVDPRAALACLQQVPAAAFLEPFHDFADVLRAVAWADQQGVRSFDYYEIAYANGGDEFCGAPNKIAFGFEHVTGACQNILTCGA